MPVRTALHSLLGGGVSGGQASEPSSAAPHRLHDCLSPPPPPPWNHSLPGNRSLLPNRWGTAELEDIRDSVIAFQKCGGGAGKRYIWILYVRNKTYGPTDNLSPSYPCLKGSLFFTTQILYGTDLGDSKRDKESSNGQISLHERR